MATDPIEREPQASRARNRGLGAARGLINGIIFTLGLWLALTGFVLLIIRR